MNVQVSIIIPVYNAEKTIERCVESLIYGKETNIEILLIDDCSADNSWDKCKKLQEKYKNIRCFQNRKNQGVSYTRNQGIDHANGKYILFVDSDDWVSGNYVQQLIQAAENNADKFVLCGYHYINKIEDTEQIFVFDKKNSESVVEENEYFSLIGAILIQQLWNKVFLHDIIKKHHLYFDENQSMGEDFQFVIEYMFAGGISKCLILNQPLYYYIRATKTSLMSKMGLSGFEQSLQRLTQFVQISGRLSTVKYYEEIQNLKQNYLYQITHDVISTKKEKLQNIESVMQDGNAKKYYRKQQLLIIRENVNDFRRKILMQKKRILGRIRRVKNELFVQKQRQTLNVKKVSVISQNCIGGVFYHDMGMEFLSPTINLFFYAEDFVRFVINLEEYLQKELKIYWDETYPVGILGDIPIYFMHYTTCTEAKKKWEERMKKISLDNIVIIATDRNGFSEELFEQWKKISYPKVLFTSQKCFAKDPNSVYYPKYKKNGYVPDLIPKREFYKNNILIDRVNELS